MSERATENDAPERCADGLGWCGGGCDACDARRPTENDRVFICDVEPRGDGGWDIWISEKPYRGVDTDAALGEWDRVRIGGTYTSRRLVGRRLTRFLANRAARLAVQKAVVRASENERSGAVWRANSERRSFRITSADSEAGV